MNQRLLWVVIVIVIIGGIVYYQQHTHTASVDLPGGKSLSVTTHD